MWNALVIITMTATVNKHSFSGKEEKDKRMGIVECGKCYDRSHRDNTEELREI